MTASYDNTLKFWDLRSVNREPIQTLSDFRDSVTTGLNIEYWLALYTVSILDVYVLYVHQWCDCVEISYPKKKCNFSMLSNSTCMYIRTYIWTYLYLWIFCLCSVGDQFLPSLSFLLVCTSDCAVLAGSVDGSVRVYDMRMGRLQVVCMFSMYIRIVVNKPTIISIISLCYVFRMHVYLRMYCTCSI